MRASACWADVTALFLAFICDEIFWSRPSRGGSLKFTLKIRHRTPGPRPWKWEIRIDDRLVTSSHESFATQALAHRAGRIALARLKQNPPAPRLSE